MQSDNMPGPAWRVRHRGNTRTHPLLSKAQALSGRHCTLLCGCTSVQPNLLTAVFLYRIRLLPETAHARMLHGCMHGPQMPACFRDISASAVAQLQLAQQLDSNLLRDCVDALAGSRHPWPFSLPAAAACAAALSFCLVYNGLQCTVASLPCGVTEAS